MIPHVTVTGLNTLLSRIQALEKRLENMEKLDEEINAHFDFSFKEEKLPIIDLELGMKRIYDGGKDEAIECLRILLITFKEDIPALQKAEKDNNFEAAYQVLQKINDGFRFSGTPRLEKIFKILYTKLRLTPDLDLRKISALFSVAYDEAKYFEEELNKMNYK